MSDEPVADEGGFDSALVASFLDTAHALYASEDLEETLARVTHAVPQLVDGCDVASVSLLDGRTIRTVAPTHDAAAAGDEIQYRCGEGPCLDAALEQRIVLANDLATDDRWPTFGKQVSDQLGVRGLLACRLWVQREDAPNVALGALNMYAFTADAFSEDDAMVSLLLGAHAAVVLDASARQMTLRSAIESRDVIGQAKGILMERHRLTAEDAFGRLRDASLQLNRKLRDIAERLAETGEEPVLRP